MSPETPDRPPEPTTSNRSRGVVPLEDVVMPVLMIGAIFVGSTVGAHICQKWLGWPRWVGVLLGFPAGFGFVFGGIMFLGRLFGRRR